MKLQTIIENGKIKWKLFDSKSNPYSWKLSIHIYESYLQKPHPHTTQTISYPDGREDKIGEFSNYVQNSFTNVIDKTYENSYSDENFIFEVWYIISNLVIYSSDIGEQPRYALETLSRGGGDCEDMVILMADMIISSSYTKDWKIQMIYFDSDNPTNPKKVNHVALLVNTGKYSQILESTAKNIVDLEMWKNVCIHGWRSDIQTRNKKIH